MVNLDGKISFHDLRSSRFICTRLLLRPTETISTISIVTIVWTMAILGIIYQTLYHERYKILEICCYVVVGVFPALVVIDMVIQLA
jgi:channel protein (hemolysin III family)